MLLFANLLIWTMLFLPLLFFIALTAFLLSVWKLNFNTSEEAVAFASKNGWKYQVHKETSKSTVTPGTHKYKYNFLPNKVSYFSIFLCSFCTCTWSFLLLTHPITVSEESDYGRIEERRVCKPPLRSVTLVHAPHLPRYTWSYPARPCCGRSR